MLGKKIINTGSVACTTDTIQILGGSSTVAYYKMQDATDETGSYNGTASNVDFNVEGKYGFAGKFNGSSSKINLGNQTFFNSGDFSVSFWFKNQGNDSAYQMLFSQRTSSDAGSPINISMYGVSFGSNPGKLYFAVGGSYIISNTALAKNVWHHVVCTIVASGAMKIYVNGSLDSNAYNETTTRPTPTNQNLAIGANGSNNTYSFNGGIDQVRIFNKAISASEVTKLYNEIQCAPAIATPESYFNSVLYTGNGGTKSVTGTGFKPDFVWIKKRLGSGYYHQLYDSVRGVQKVIFSNDTSIEYARSGGITSFDGNGFTLGNHPHSNESGQTFVSWSWKAAASNTTNNDGTVQTTVRASQESGFSIVTHTSPSGAYTWGHGLSKTPELWLHKATNYTYGWETLYPDTFGTNNTDLIPADWNYLRLDTTAATSSSGYSANKTVLSSTGWGQVNNFVTYCFHSVDGYQRIGSYVGNGSANGPFIYTGFEPAWIMIKRTDATGAWNIFDNKRNSTNPRNTILQADKSDPEYTNTAYNFNFYTNGFQSLNTVADWNASGGSYIFMAIAANPDTTAPTKANSFKTKIYSGNGGTQSITGLGFKPDLLWWKARNSGSYNWKAVDSINGPTKNLYPNLTNALASDVATTSFDSDGFTFGSGGNGNVSSLNYVSYAWKGLDHDRNLAAINTDGTIPSIVSANVESGFSIVNHTAPSSGYYNVGHGLSSKPQLVLTKPLAGSYNWYSWAEGLADESKSYLLLDTNNGDLVGNNYNMWSASGSGFNNSTFGHRVGYSAIANGNQIAYLFHSVAGYSKIGTYTGNNGSGVNKITLDFRPSWLMVKKTSDAAYASWYIFDSTRGDIYLQVNNAATDTASATYNPTFLDDGFQWENGDNSGGWNGNGSTNLYMAFK